MFSTKYKKLHELDKHCFLWLENAYCRTCPILLMGNIDYTSLLFRSMSRSCVSLFILLSLLFFLFVYCNVFIVSATIRFQFFILLMKETNHSGLR